MAGLTPVLPERRPSLAAYVHVLRQTLLDSATRDRKHSQAKAAVATTLARMLESHLQLASAHDTIVQWPRVSVSKPHLFRIVRGNVPAQCGCSDLKRCFSRMYQPARFCRYLLRRS